MKHNKINKKFLQYVKWKIGGVKKYLEYYYFTHVHVVGFPKSGNTWVKLFLARYFSKLFNVEQPENFQRLHHYPYVKSIFFSHVGPRIFGDNVLETILKIKNQDYILKTIIRLKNKKILFIARDPRDVVVSYYFHMKYLSKSSKYKNIKISEFVRDDSTGIYSIINYMNTWNRNSKLFNNFTIIHYEFLKNNTKNEFLKIINFVNMNRNQKILQEVIDYTKFENMKKMEKNGNTKNRSFLLRVPNINETFRMRKGKIGGYKEYLCSKDIKYVNRQMKFLDKEFNYNA